jgi:predicted CXXCH cytochrome family protein
MTRSRLLALSAAAALAAGAGPAAGADPCALATADRLQATSRDCLACHDGSVASAPVGGSARGGHHPIDLDYARAAASNPRLATLFEVSRSLVLPSGQVSCVTCHDGASTQPMHTALTMDRSRLCTGCHLV